jgi:alanine racemase
MLTKKISQKNITKKYHTKISHKNKTYKTTQTCINEIPNNYKNIKATISIKALKHNLVYLKQKSGADVMPVLKANAYGHGIIEIAKICRKFDVKYIGVATLGEAIQIRNSGDNGRILGWLYDINSDEVKDAVAKNIDIGIFDDYHIPIISKSLPKDTKANVHLFIDTGINRNGIPYERAIDAAKEITNDPKFNLIGVMSHFCCAETKQNNPTIEQLKLFRKLRENLYEINIKPELFHIAATDGILNYDVSDFPLVRSGTGFFGIDKSQDKNLIPALSLTSKILQLKYIPKGAGVGYNKKYIAPRKQYIAIIPIGYADLLPLVPDEKISVNVNGKIRKILGLESMDQIVIQAKKGDKIGDEVRFFGDKNNGFTTAIDFAKPSGTNTLNIITHMSNRVKREYIE